MTTLPTLCITGKLELKVCAVSQVSVKGLKVELLYLASYSLVLFDRSRYRSGTLNSNTVNSKFHLIRSFFEIFARFLSFHV